MKHIKAIQVCYNIWSIISEKQEINKISDMKRKENMKLVQILD